MIVVIFRHQIKSEGACEVKLENMNQVKMVLRGNQVEMDYNSIKLNWKK